MFGTISQNIQSPGGASDICQHSVASLLRVFSNEIQHQKSSTFNHNSSMWIFNTLLMDTKSHSCWLMWIALQALVWGFSLSIVVGVGSFHSRSFFQGAAFGQHLGGQYPQKRNPCLLKKGAWNYFSGHQSFYQPQFFSL